MMLYNLRTDLKIKLGKIESIFAILFITAYICVSCGPSYANSYKTDYYSYARRIIEYANENKQNAYLCTMPSMQNRYLAYSVYEMPPEGAFSNIRVIGGWDMMTENYNNFKERYNLDGTFLDLLKDNVYLIDGETKVYGIKYENFKEYIIQSIKDHYGIDVTCELVKDLDDQVHVYKVREVK